MIKGWYYLHTNGELIYKQDIGSIAADIRESPFAVMMWPVDTRDRAAAWRILIEALACGARKDRVMELANKWKCNDDDAQIYAEKVGAVLKKDGDQWCATRGDFKNLQQSPAGFGDTALEAFADLCKNLGYKPAKTWGMTFAGLLHHKRMEAHDAEV
ncbi:MAG: hypothetical protein SVK08_02450 [Halobacteriota archaeon]|nr:hypothetical protein [Halobacteriota archaeon]